MTFALQDMGGVVVDKVLEYDVFEAAFEAV